MSFHSILFPRPGAIVNERPPEFFHDLNLDQIVATITAGREDFDLAPYFQSPLQDIDAIDYRQEVMRELDGTAARQSIGAFSERMRAMRAQLAQADKALRCHGQSPATAPPST
jgi:hypothetical protein